MNDSFETTELVAVPSTEGTQKTLTPSEKILFAVGKEVQLFFFNIGLSTLSYGDDIHDFSKPIATGIFALSDYIVRAGRAVLDKVGLDTDTEIARGIRYAAPLVATFVGLREYLNSNPTVQPTESGLITIALYLGALQTGKYAYEHKEKVKEFMENCINGCVTFLDDMGPGGRMDLNGEIFQNKIFEMMIGPELWFQEMSSVIHRASTVTEFSLTGDISKLDSWMRVRAEDFVRKFRGFDGQENYTIHDDVFLPAAFDFFTRVRNRLDKAGQLGQFQRIGNNMLKTFSTRVAATVGENISDKRIRLLMADFKKVDRVEKFAYVLSNGSLVGYEDAE